jgi:protein-disulfide isomerase
VIRGWPLAALVAAVGCAPPTPAQSTSSSSSTIAARVGDRTITLEQVDQRALVADAGDYAGLRLREALYEARRAALDEIIADHLLTLEERTRGLSREDLLEREVTAKIRPVSEAEVEAWYRANPDRVGGASVDQVRAPIRQLLERERRQQALGALLDTLKRKIPVTILLEPPRERIQVAADEPALGPPKAPVLIVEYSDFQWPFCGRVGSTLRQLREAYGDRLRLVYRDFPLPNHAQAFKAAEAAQCAHAQGRFWPYHDLLFANQARLAPADLKRYAAEIGLDRAAFDRCLDEGQARAAVEQDLNQGQQLGVAATPTFFINGRFVSGAQPFERFKAIIDEELARASR